MQKIIYPVGAVIVSLLIWEVAVWVLKTPSYLLPSPHEIVKVLITQFDVLLFHSWITLLETVAGFLLGIALGVPLAVAIVWSKRLDLTLTPLLVLSQSFPKVAIAPLLIVWFGFGLAPKIAVSFLIAFFPIVVAAVAGMRSVETDMIEMVRCNGASTFQVFTRVRLPFALPSIFAGLKVAITFALVGAVVGEWVGADQGLGYLLLWTNANLNTVLLFAVLVMLMLIGMVLFYAVVFAEQLMLPWHVSVREQEIVVTI